MKDGIKQILGKRITAFVVTESPTAPRRQVFLIFSDNTHFEFYGHEFTGASGLGTGGLEQVRDYVAKFSSAEITMQAVE